MKHQALILTVLLLISPLVAQTEISQTIYNTQFEKSKMAIPDFKLEVGHSGFDSAWATLNAVLKQDVANSGYFELLSPELIRLIKSPFSSAIDFAEWGSIQAQHLVVGVIQEEAGQMRIEVRLFEIPSRQTILAKAYKVKKELARKAAHVIADDLLKHLKNLNFANSKIIFSKETLVQADQDRYLAKDLYIMDYDGYNPLPITRRSMAISPHAIRHEGQIWLAYCRYKNANTFVASYGMVFQKGLQQPPVPLIESDVTRTSTPSLSPGGDKIAFSMVEEGNVDIYVMNLDGSNLLRLTRHPGVDTNPSWAPGGRSLLFTSDRTGAPQIYRMDADGVNRERITFDNPYNDGAVWNPRYDYIAYLSRFDSEFDIFVMDLKTRQSYRLTYRQGSNEDPCWSPDGERLCFSSNRSGSWQLYIVNRTDKDSVIQITHEGNNKTPVWVE